MRREYRNQWKLERALLYSGGGAASGEGMSQLPTVAKLEQRKSSLEASIDESRRGVGEFQWRQGEVRRGRSTAAGRARSVSGRPGGIID